jgi:hypothetical protein
MNLDQKYASYLINAANVFASQRSTGCKAAESLFEQRLLKLFEQARESGVEQQDIAVIASTAIAVILTKPASFVEVCEAEPAKKRPHILKAFENVD